eukprot:Phypoly_transcript_01839.p1 GENE.Phypoly_transcript_01839~~Phypoly_transcript_01839.p1  ORF type:complete len:919 (+),score=142.10 Phypoly_transcript_01839:139-2895(+)
MNLQPQPPQPNLCLIQNTYSLTLTTPYIPPPSLHTLLSSLDTNRDYILLLGENGSGKSSLLAHLWLKKDNLQDELQKRPLFVHFLGDLHYALIRLYEEINEHLGEGDKLAFPNASGLLDAFPTFIDAISRKGGIVICFDALPAQYHDLHWLPKVLPDRVHILFSSVSGTKIEAEIEKLDAKVVKVLPQQAQQKRELVSKKLEFYGKMIPDEMVEKLISHKLSDNILFINVVLGAMCSTDYSAENFNPLLDSDDTSSLFQKVLLRWEETYGKDLTKKVLLLIASSRFGIEESTIRHIMAEFSTDLLPFLSEIGPILVVLQGKLNFINEFFMRTITQRYSTTDKSDACNELINFWQSSPFTQRTAYELPWLLCEKAKADPTNEDVQWELGDILLDLNNIETFHSQRALQHDIVLYWNSLKNLDPLWDFQEYLPRIREVYKNPTDKSESILTCLAEWLLYAGSPINKHVTAVLGKQRGNIERKMERKLHPPPKCYMCKQKSRKSFGPEQFGLTLCIACVEKNKKMMDQWDSLTDLEECVALVTGARIKIGYFVALRLLRSGVTVIALTRFPHDAALKYSRESDFDLWKNKLHIYGVDLRHIPSVNQFISHVLQRYKRIDMLINNAAQTKRRPRAYYFEVISREKRLMGGELEPKFLVKNFTSDPFAIEYNTRADADDLERKSKRAKIDHEERQLQTAIVPVMAIDSVTLDPSLPMSAALTQVPLLPMDKKERDDTLFPPGLVDEHNEPLDLRRSTTWTQNIEEISTLEMVEVQIVNATVPFMLISAFTPLLKEAAKISTHKRSFIVNVTAVEGNFNNVKKDGAHPHTNMAKAALNMLTKSISATYARINIFVTSVDTGWCTEMRYVPKEKRHPEGPPLIPVPLTDKDGAARVLYPIYIGLTSADPPPHGVLYHNYEVKPFT